MKKPFLAMLVLALAIPATGCVVRTRTGSRQSDVRSCPPAHHWEGGACVHNGGGRGNGNGKGKEK